MVGTHSTANSTLAARRATSALPWLAVNPWDGIGEQPLDLPGSVSPAVRIGRERTRRVIEGRDLVFVPYFDRHRERYSTYFQIV